MSSVRMNHEWRTDSNCNLSNISNLIFMSGTFLHQTLFKLYLKTLAISKSQSISFYTLLTALWDLHEVIQLLTFIDPSNILPHSAVPFKDAKWQNSCNAPWKGYGSAGVHPNTPHQIDDPLSFWSSGSCLSLYHLSLSFIFCLRWCIKDFYSPALTLGLRHYLKN